MKRKKVNEFIKCTLDTGRYFFVGIQDEELLSKYNWIMNNLGYVFYGHSGLLHRLIMKPKKEQVVDPINGKPWDCRRKNMRAVTQKQNSYNSKINKNNKTGYKGVSYSKERDKYEACICINGRTKHLGRYKTSIEAALVYNQAASFYFGEYAKLNKIGGRQNEEKVLELG